MKLSAEKSITATEESTVSPYVDLIKDHWTHHELLDPNFTVRIRSEMIHLHLKCVHAHRRDAIDTPDPQPCWAGVKWVDFSSVTAWIDEESAVCDLDSLTSKEIILENGAAKQPRALLLRKNEDVLIIQFSFGDSPGDATIIDHS